MVVCQNKWLTQDPGFYIVQPDELSTFGQGLTLKSVLVARIEVTSRIRKMLLAIWRDQRVAVAAADGSFSAWEKIIARICADPGAAAHKFLPVIFANLDSVRISDPILGTPSHAIVNLAFNAVISVALFRELPLPVLRELWPQMWRWIQFVEAHEHHLYQKDDAVPAIFPLFIQ
ncbi:hypothetical protein DFH08DRAFT_821621 [Mycena albidolilacea]|uniref:Uncharacterized protein n=1 Tax=Mycena albidolilacea TaxID=1033008 RepID=A0AAD6ZAM2_9AGAR|nr:hypothetical protein DFH08DRAFT_821621 [Mycena albidolilacea]